MGSKSHVTIEQHQCPVCGAVFDTGAILLDRRLAERFNQYTVTGQSLCPEHLADIEGGYILGIVCANERLDGRTGQIVKIKASAWPKLFNVPPPPKGVFAVSPETAEVLSSLVVEPASQPH
jgi:hypothetical protein